MTPERWQEVKQYVAAALERKPGERSAYLDRTCVEPSLRQEVESMIAAHEHGNTSFLEPSSVESEQLKNGTRLGCYEIVAPIGSGGMGEVYRAHDTKLGRDGDKMMAVDIYTQPSFATSKPRQLFEGDYALNYFAGRFYDVSTDGERFLMLKPVEQAQSAPTQINVVLNWLKS